jgi:serine/threonine protein phosphatase PrpC
MKTKIEVGNLSDIGKKRTANEDYFGLYEGIYGNLIVVCDGMGGNKGGYRASRLAVETIKEEFDKIKGINYDPKVVLKEAMIQADIKMKKESAENVELKEMGSTAVILLIKEGEAYTAHIGDSRIYMIREGNIHQLTKDHSLVQQMIDGGIITAERAKDHPNKNVIVRSLGADGSSEPEIAEPFQVFKNDYYILCSDGLTAYVDEYELQEIVTTNSPQVSCSKLINIANERGGKDNITVQIVKVKKGKHLPIKKETIRKASYGFSVLLILLLSYFLYPQIEPVLQKTFFSDKDSTQVKKIDNTKKKGANNKAQEKGENATNDSIINKNTLNDTVSNNNLEQKKPTETKTPPKVVEKKVKETKKHTKKSNEKKK